MSILDGTPGGRRRPDRSSFHDVARSVPESMKQMLPRLSRASLSMHVHGLWPAGTLGGPDLHKNKSWPKAGSVETEFVRAFLAGFAA